MSTQYLGLVIGGPADGQRIVHDSTKLVVLEKPRNVLLVKNGLSYASPRHVYNWHDAGPIGLWLLDGWTIEQGQKHMADTIGVAALADRYEQIIARRKDDERRG